MEKSFLCVVVIVTFLVTASRARSAAFQNLDFESATIAAAPANYTPTDAYNPISAAAALPGWTVHEDTTQCTAVWGQAEALDETSVGLVYSTSSLQEVPIDGKYSVELYSAVYPTATGSPSYYSNASISQVGLVPNGTHSIRFSIDGVSNVTANPIVMLGNNSIALKTLSTSGGVTILEGDVSSFAGQTVDLTFLSQGLQGSSFPSNEDLFYLDDIQFSTAYVPEPATVCIPIVFCVIVGWRLLVSRSSGIDVAFG